MDDEPDIREILTLLLTDEGYNVLAAADGAQALSLLQKNPELIILDVMMPEQSGYDVCRAIRETSLVPILFLSARSQETDKVLGLRYGGDDYLTKPFSPSELSARVDALLRRYNVYRGNAVSQAKTFARERVVIDFASGNVLLDGEPVPLTDIEYRLLSCLAQHAGDTLDTRTIYSQVWKEPYLDSAASTIMVHIRNLRKKLERDPANPTLIRTVWGRGYRVDA